MVYFVGDYDRPVLNDIGYMLPAINRMELAGSTSDVNIVVQADDLNIWGGETRRYYIIHNDDLYNINSPLADPDTSEKNMGDPTTLSDYLIWATNKYPAKHNALVIFSHGAGWGGIGYDQSSGAPYDDESYMDINELENAISYSGVHLDILFLWACESGQIEVYYQLKNYVDIVIASETCTSFCNNTCEEPLKELTANPTLNPIEISQIIVDSYSFTLFENRDYSSRGWPGIKTFFGVPMEYISNLTKAVNNFAEAMLNASNRWQVWRVVMNAFKKSKYFSIYDLYEFGDFISKSALEPPIIDAARNIVSHIDSSLIIEPHSSPNKLHGIRTHPPAHRDPFAPFSGYKNTTFAKDTKWDEFLSEFYYIFNFDSDSAVSSDADGISSIEEQQKYISRSSNEERNLFELNRKPEDL